jgi:hypothetical protein
MKTSHPFGAPSLAACLAGWLTLATAATPAAAQALLDKIDDALAWQNRSGEVRMDLSALIDLEGYYIDRFPPGLLFSQQSFIAPRFSLFLDARLGPHFYALLQTRVDKGFDPKATGWDARLDEYLVRWSPLTESQVNVQAGKFATVVGNWVRRHDSWQNPFITAPVPYENVTVITDQFAPATPAAFLGRQAMADARGRWLPVLWGPAYTSGASVFGSLQQWDYAVAFKNASISSRPFVWGAEELNWDHPTWELRLGHRPGPRWNHGLSFSRGAYLLPAAEGTLPPGRTLGDYNQMTLGWDAGFAWRKWQFWGEAFASRFQVPNVGNADTFTYYLEAKYKLTARLYAAARWNQQVFGTVPNGLGGRQVWDADMVHTDLALGCRFTRHVQAKIQYSLSDQRGPFEQGEQLLAGQLTLKF